MGVKGLWGFLAPHAERQPLYQLRGEKVAIDLSGWVCDSQNVTDQHAEPRLYLRNLYFRACYLIMLGVVPIFVLEGEAPKIKQSTMANRNLIQYRNVPKASKENRLRKPCTQRRRFKSVLLLCETLLKSMGLECVRGVGEAEAMCAHLNSTGIVSAVISQDSDCFVYGATRVYRNFSICNSGSNAANSGSVEVYDLNKIKDKLNFGRKKMVALALLCGSDYNGNGIEGVGHANALSFLQHCIEETVIERLTSWITEPVVFEDMAKTMEDPMRCSGCGHRGNIRSHSRSGCVTCKTTRSCDQSVYKDRYQRLKIELMIRSKVLKNTDGFPDADLIDEYLTDKEVTPDEFKPLWKKPDLIKFIKLMCKSLDWTEIYCVEKFLPLLTKWQLMYKARNIVKTRTLLYVDENKNNEWLTPLFIKKKRNPKGVACYEIVWKDNGGHYEGLIPDDQLEDKNEEQIWSTVEHQDLVEAAYPDLVETFLNQKKNNKKPKTAKKRGNKVSEKNRIELESSNYHDKLTNVDISMKNLSLTENPKSNVKKGKKRKTTSAEVSFKTKPRKYKRKNIEKVNSSQRKLDSFLSIKSINQKTKKITNSIENDTNLSKINKECVNINDSQSFLKNTTQTFGNSFNYDCTNDDIDEEDLSIAIENIINRNDDHYQKFLNDNCSTPIKNVHNLKNEMSDMKQSCSTPLPSSTRRESYFFGNIGEENDAFEASFNLKNNCDDSFQCSNLTMKNSSKMSWTNNYSIVNNLKHIADQSSRRNSSCCTPLLDRINKLRKT